MTVSREFSRHFRQFALAMLFVLPAAHAGAAGEGVTLTNAVFEEVEVVLANGSKQKKLQPLTKAVPGKQVVYETRYENKGRKPAEAVVIRNPVSASLRYVPGSAEGAGTRAEVSVDGGKQFGALDKLTVTEADGKLRPARPEDVNMVRWTLLAPVPPGAGGKVAFRAAVR